MATSGCSTSASPTALPLPVTMFSTPGGSPASCRTCAKRIPTSGVYVAGLKTTVFPHSSAGMIFHDGIAMGKFHGVITPTTPTGTRMQYAALLGISLGAV